MKTPKTEPLLSVPDDGPQDEDWTFLWKSKCGTVFENDWASEVLFYELARELDSEVRYSGDPQGFLKDISAGRFPATPFLKLSEQEQKNLVRKMRKPKSVFRQVESLKQQPVFGWHFERRLTDTAEEHLENVAREAAEAEAEKWVGLNPDYLRQGSNPGERAAAAERNRILGKGEAIFDEAKCMVTLHIDLDFPDHTIKREFENVLTEIRTQNTPHSRQHETRGKNQSTILDLRDLAAWRMKNRFGSYDKIVEIMTVDEEKKKLPDLPIESKGGWTKAVNRGDKLVERFREWWPCSPA